ncbi:hypothetical protein GWI34_16685 [Actinomadura sp. DSM 109109]|nr:hypothetical protein [Actinomadura lepetitiana]
MQDELEQVAGEVRAVSASSLDLREGQCSRNRAKVRTVGSVGWLAAIWFASSTVVEVGSCRESSVTGDGRGYVEDVGGCSRDTGADNRVLDVAHLPRGCGGGSGSVLVDRRPFLRSQLPSVEAPLERVTSVLGRPAVAKLGEGEVGGESSSGEPDWLAFLVGVVWKCDCVTGDLSRSAGALTGLDQHSSLFEGGEEVVFGFGSGGCGGYVPAEDGARRLRPVLAMGEFCLGSGRSRCGCSVGGRGSGEAVAFLDDVAGVGNLVVVTVDVRVASVLAGQDDSEVDMVVGVPYCDPAACLVVASACKSGLVHHLFGDVGPFIV